MKKGLQCETETTWEIVTPFDGTSLYGMTSSLVTQT